MMIKGNLEAIKERMARAAERSGRAADAARLVAVTKTVPPERVAEAMAAGAADLGENYIQEAREKIAALPNAPARWHFIGHLQKNKAKYAVELFQTIHAVDDFKLAEELNRRAGALGKRIVILLQANLAAEASKSGLNEDGVRRLAAEVIALPHLDLRGLMTMPPWLPPEEARPFFAALRRLRDNLERELKIPLPELSMGMSGDFEAAIEEGATWVRVGSAIFGTRPAAR